VVAAASVLVLLAVAVPRFLPHHPRSESPASVAASFEPVRKLPDGSIVELNTGAEIAVRFEDSTRRVVLLRGEAHFRVEKDASRPFVVEANGVAVRAVGTAFTVQLERDALEVVVTDGRIAIDRPAAAAPAGPAAAAPAPLATVAAGNRVFVATTSQLPSSPRIEPMTDAQIEKRLAWRIPRLDFDGMELAEAVKCMNRENRLQIVLGDEAIGRLRISGVFRTDSPAAFVTIVTRSFGLSATQRNESEIILNAP
jgi:transmembrane sensor